MAICPEFSDAIFGAETGFLASERVFGGAVWRRRVRTGPARQLMKGPCDVRGPRRPDAAGTGPARGAVTGAAQGV